MNEEEPFIIENPYLIRRLYEIETDMKKRNMIKEEPRLNSKDRFVATLIAWYEATKDIGTPIANRTNQEKI